MADVDSRLRALARKYIWWGNPDDALRQPAIFACRLMQLGTWEDVRLARSLLGDEVFEQGLRQAPPGILDARSWNFWHLFFGMTPVPPMPTRAIP